MTETYSMKSAAKRKPLHGWNCAYDVQKFKEILDAARKADEGLVLSPEHIAKGFSLGIHPEKLFKLMQDQWPPLNFDKKLVARIVGEIAHQYCDSTEPPGENATGIRGEENSDGSWDAGWDGTVFEVLREWQWIADSNQFIHDDGLQRYDDRQFKRLFGKVTPDKAILTELDRGKVPMKKFAAQVYVPNKPTVFRYDLQPPMHYSGRLAYNLWRPHDLKPKAGDVSWFLDHLEKLFPGDQRSQELVIDYMAQLVKHPDVKINFALLIQSAEGAGKGALGHILRRIIGGRNCVEPDSDEFVDTYSGWQECAQLAIVAEVWIDGDRRLLDSLKKRITEDTLRIHKKFGNRFSIPNYLNFFCMTNHKDAIPITKHDRRWLVLSSPFVPKRTNDEKDYFDALWAKIEDGDAIAAVFQFLLDHEITINPKGHAPMTKAKIEMQERAQSDTLTDLKNLFDAGFGPFKHDVIRADDIVAWLRDERKYIKDAHSQARALLDNVNAKELRRYKEGLPEIPAYRLYAIRKQDEWSKRSPKTVALEYHSRLVGDADGDFDFG